MLKKSKRKIRYLNNGKFINIESNHSLYHIYFNRTNDEIFNKASINSEDNIKE